MKAAKPIPHQCLVPYLSMKGADKAIDFYKKAFGATEIGRIKMPDGKIAHAEIKIGDSHFMIAEEIEAWGNKSPQTLGGSPVGLFLYVDDVDAVFKEALEAGAKVDNGMEVKDQFYGDRTGNLIDPFGHKWTVGTHFEDMSYAEMQVKMDEMMKENK